MVEPTNAVDSHYTITTVPSDVAEGRLRAKKHPYSCLAKAAYHTKTFTLASVHRFICTSLPPHEAFPSHFGNPMHHLSTQLLLYGPEPEVISACPSQQDFPHCAVPQKPARQHQAMNANGYSIRY